VATISRLLKIICLFCKRALQKRLYSAKETYNFKEPTNRSHPIPHPALRLLFAHTHTPYLSHSLSLSLAHPPTLFPSTRVRRSIETTVHTHTHTPYLSHTLSLFVAHPPSLFPSTRVRHSIETTIHTHTHTHTLSFQLTHLYLSHTLPPYPPQLG